MIKTRIGMNRAGAWHMRVGYPLDKMVYDACQAPGEQEGYAACGNHPDYLEGARHERREKT